MAEEKDDNLELFLSDVYEKECVFKIKKDELEFIQTHVETLIHRFVDKILAPDPIWDNIEQDLELFRSEGGKINRLKGDIIKVGSFYEGTKNYFPGEFDLIYPFYCCEETKCMDGYLKVILERILGKTVELIYKRVHELQKLPDKGDMCYSSTDGTKTLSFDKFIGKAGPAVTVSLTYGNSSGLHEEIYIDLVPAVVIKDEKLEKIVDQYCVCKPFHKEVMSLGRILMVDRRITFTETEVHVMRNMLSENHRKLYRILKHLINGNGSGPKKISSLSTLKDYSSYMIKTMMIFHHFKCIKPSTAGLGPCILEILNEMGTHKDNTTFPSLLIRPPEFKSNEYFLRRYLLDMTDKLTLMQKSAERYDYEKLRIGKSLNTQFFENLGPKTDEDDSNLDDLDIYPHFFDC